MANKNLVLHVGPYKTGTSYLQSCFTNNHVLLKKYGWLYSTSPVVFGGNGHHKLARHYCNNKVESIAKGIRYLNNTPDNIIISSEDLMGLNKHGALNLKQDFSHFEIKIIYYIRQRSGLVTSYWQELVKHGATQSLPEFVLEKTFSLHNFMAFNHALRLDMYKQVFGLDKISVRFYDEIVHNKIDIFRNFLSQELAINMSIEDEASLIIPKNVNVSLKKGTVELLRVMNLINQNSEVAPVVLRDTLLSLIHHKEVSETVTFFDELYIKNKVSINVTRLNNMLLQVDRRIIKQFDCRLSNSEKVKDYNELNQYFGQHSPLEYLPDTVLLSNAEVLMKANKVYQIIMDTVKNK